MAANGNSNEISADEIYYSGEEEVVNNEEGEPQPTLTDVDTIISQNK